MVVTFRSRRNFQAFLKEFTQKVMFHITGARKGSQKGKFFDQIVFSRVVEWGKGFATLKDYIWKNNLENFGFSQREIRTFRTNNKLVPS
jgi:hypothetical protein